MKRVMNWWDHITRCGHAGSVSSQPPPLELGLTSGKPGSMQSSMSNHPILATPHPNLSGAANAVPNYTPGHYVSYPNGGPMPPIRPGQPLVWPPNMPAAQPIPAYLLRLPDMVAEKLKLCGIVVIYQTSSDEYQLLLTSPRYVAMHIKHDAPAELWAAAMKYMVETAGKPLPAAVMNVAAGHQKHP